MDKPFDGAISKFFARKLPRDLRDQIRAAKPSAILAADYPYRSQMGAAPYQAAYDALQIELAKLQAWVRATGARVAVVVEGRDAAGKGGTIKHFRLNLNPRGARVVALPAPSEAERGQWYFQRYIEHLPGAGELAFFDRSWYNRAVVERVFGFSTPAQRESFFAQVNDFEAMLVQDGIHLFKLWLTIGRAEQMRRMLAREADPLKQWKLSQIDVDSLGRWDDYTSAISDMFARTHTETAPWQVILADDKRRARLATQQIVLSRLPYARRDPDVAHAPDPALVGGPEILG